MVKKIINIASSFAIRNNINSVDDYYLASNKNELDSEYKETLASNGYDNNFFASLSTNDNSNRA